MPKILGVAALQDGVLSVLDEDESVISLSTVIFSYLPGTYILSLPDE